jgi:predicted ATP-dependent serine protease
MRTCPVTGLTWSAPTVILVHGPPGAGKSTIGVQLVSQCKGVLCLSLEEGPGPALARRLALAGCATREDVSIVFSGGAEALLDAAARGHAVLLDSVQCATLVPEDLVRIAQAGAPLVVAVAQETKSGEARGSLEWAHLADIVLRVGAGRWTTEKNRYGAQSSGEVRGYSSPAPSSSPTSRSTPDPTSQEDSNVIPFRPATSTRSPR